MAETAGSEKRIPFPAPPWRVIEPFQEPSMFPTIRNLRRVATLTALTLGATALPAVAGAQDAPHRIVPPATLDAATRRAVLDTLGAYLERTYVSRDTARRIAAVLQRRLTAGAYDTIASPDRLAEVVTRDLRAVNGDLHLGLRYAAADSRRGVKPGARGVPYRAFVEPVGGLPADGDGPEDDPRVRYARERNYGLARAEVLPGNVGYLEITEFVGAPGAQKAVAAALRFLERTEVVIIDVRRNGGGSSMLSHYIFSHFLGAEPVPTVKVVNPASGDSATQVSFRHVAGPRRPEVPLYVLTSGFSGSAAEEFPFVLQQLGRATIVGARTAGAGHMVTQLDVGHGFTASVSITRVTAPRSGKEWERVGVQPDVMADPTRALDVAHAHALRTIASRSTEPRRSQLARLAETADARAAAPALDPVRARALSGSFDGRQVIVRDGRLWLRDNAGDPGTELVPLADGRYAMGASRVSFETRGAAVRMRIEREDGTRAEYLRDRAEP
jgi:hypothetical protein